jgi:hypothetical protein
MCINKQLKIKKMAKIFITKDLMQNLEDSISSDNYCALSIIVLYEIGAFNIEQLKGYFKSFKCGKLDTYKTTKKVKLFGSDKWFSNLEMYQIFSSIFTWDVPQFKVDFENVLKHFQRFMPIQNDRASYQIILSNISDKIEKYCCENLHKLNTVSEIIDADYMKNIVKFDDFTPNGYCCEDCDGNYDTYKYFKYNFEILDSVRQSIKDTIHVFKLCANCLYFE